MLWEALENAASRDAAPNALLEVIIAGARLACHGLLLIGGQGGHQQEAHALIPMGGGVP